jgi:hypothetical protein
MLYVGLAISGIGLILYITHTVLYNHYLRKNRPDILEHFGSKPGNSRKKQKGNREPEVRVVITESGTPGWVILLGFPAIPIFFVGIAVTILSLIIKALVWIF